MRSSPALLTSLVLSLSSLVHPTLALPSNDPNPPAAYKDVAKRHADYLLRRQAAVAPAAASSSAAAPPAGGAGGASITVPPLAAITSGMPVEPTMALPTTYSAGAQPPISGAPALPAASAIVASAYPPTDQVPPINSPEVQGWLKEIAGANIPNLSTTGDGTCASNQAAANDKSRCWWTCGGCTRPTDITTCPDKGTWGLSYDDGPTTYTPKLLNFLSQKQLKATFFVVGSRVVYNAPILQAEYMSGHQLSVHTWSHPPLTTLTNEQIVAELGWTRKIIKDTLGVTPNTMRPPYGDIDDRVRAIANAMGLTPIIWTGIGEAEFDTNDWNVPGGIKTGTQAVAAFNNIISQAGNLNTGFIVLEHDLFQQEVDLSVGYFLPAALSHTPKFTLEPIIQCQKKGAADAYKETFTNSTQPPAASGTSGSGSGAGTTGSAAGGGSTPTQTGGSANPSGTTKPNSASTLGFSTTSAVLVIGSIVLGAISL